MYIRLVLLLFVCFRYGDNMRRRWTSTTLCGLGNDRKHLVFENCPNQCSNITNLITLQTRYQCAPLGRCPFGRQCTMRKHLVVCCCSQNFCNLGELDPVSIRTTTIRAKTDKSSTEMSHQTSTMTTGLSSTTTPIPSTSYFRDPTTYPNSNPTDEPAIVCFTGVTLGFLPADRWTTGALMTCQGACTNITFAMFYIPITAYICDVNSLCDNWEMNSCDYVPQGTPMTMCCCNSSSTCNVALSTPLPSPIPSVSTKSDTNNTCFIGFSFQNEVPVTMNVSIPANLPIGNFELCGGDCANITLGDFGTLYTCDPISVCVGLSLTDNCGDIVKGILVGCCCNGPNCNLNNQTAAFKTTPSPLRVTTSPSAVPWTSISTIIVALRIFTSLIND